MQNIDDEKISNQFTAPFNDWVLQRFVTLANIGDLKVPVSLQVKGTYIYGTLVSGMAYSEDLELNLVRDENSEEWNEYWRKFVSQIKELYEYDNYKKTKSSQFIHLKNAKICMGNHTYATNMLRCKLYEVDGWCLGTPENNNNHKLKKIEKEEQ